MPSLYTSILRRKTTLWFFVAVILQNYFLSSPYGRNWFYLFSSQHVPTWAILVLTAFFFVVVWALFLAFFAVVSKRHPWWLPALRARPRSPTLGADAVGNQRVRTIPSPGPGRPCGRQSSAARCGSGLDSSIPYRARGWA